MDVPKPRKPNMCLHINMSVDGVKINSGIFPPMVTGEKFTSVI